MASTSSFFFLAALASISGVQASSECFQSVYNQTIALFNSAPFAYSLELDTASHCQNWCNETPKCQAWVYVENSGHCDLHRTGPLSLLDNNGFTFGGCEPVNATRPVVTTTDRALIPTPSRTPVELGDNFSVWIQILCSVSIPRS